MDGDQKELQVEAVEYLRDAAGFLRTLGELVYTELTEEQIENLKNIDFERMACLKEGLLEEGFRGIGRYLLRCGVNVRQDLAVDYARVFLGAGVASDQSAAPFESVFTSPEGLLMQDARDEVVAVYRKFGTVIDSSVNVPEDHLGFELTFLGNLAEDTANALEGGELDAGLLEAQTSFIDEHILNWVEMLADRVEEYALTPFYPCVMKVITGYVREHRAALMEIQS